MEEPWGGSVGHSVGEMEGWGGCAVNRFLLAGVLGLLLHPPEEKTAKRTPDRAHPPPPPPLTYLQGEPIHSIESTK